MSRRLLRSLVGQVLFVVAVLAPWASGAEWVGQSARQIPVAYDVDVVVVGGSTGAVSAAVAAAKTGAKVFLAAPRPYLGDDMTATLRLWLEEGETPQSELARRVFEDPVETTTGRHPRAMDFVYQADLASNPRHRDTDPPSLLTDGKWSSPSTQSVQYDGDVTIVADLGQPKPIDEVRLMVFYRGSADRAANFVVRNVTLATSDDKQSWADAGEVANRSAEDVTKLAVAVGRTARYVRLVVRKKEDVDRILLGELEILAPRTGPVPEAQAFAHAPRPLHVKKILDDALLEAGVEFLYGCQPTEVVRDEKGLPRGIVMANRAGRQAVLARSIIDATDRAWVARMAGARFRPFPAGVQTFRRVVIGGEVRQAEGLVARVVGMPFLGVYPNPAKTSSGEYRIIEYTLKIPVEADTPGAWAAADQQARTMTYHPEQQFTADRLFQVPPDPVQGAGSCDGPWQGVEALPLAAFRPAGVEHLFILSGAADVSRPQAAGLLRPVALMDLGERIGRAAAEDASARAKSPGAAVATRSVERPTTEGDIGEALVGVRPIQELKTICQPAGALPVLGHWDVVVIGGGTSGSPAGIGAARRGAKTLVVEYLHGLGGVGTSGAISSYYWGNRVGFSATVMGGQHRWVIEQKMEWWRRALVDAGADVWFGTIGCGAVVEGSRVKGAVVAGPWGRGVVLADVVIDATGNSDIAAVAGARTVYTDYHELAIQGTGLPGRKLGATYTNTDFTITDETDMVDIWHLFVFAKDKYADAFDQGKLIDTRERRRVVGDFTMTILDQINQRTYPDTVEIAYSNFDTHGYTVDPYIELKHPEKAGVRVNVPYRCMLPKGLEGILVAGLGMSVHRDALPLTRMQADLQNQGYALGVAAAMAAEANVSVRKIDVKALQRHLVEIGNLPESVLTDVDSYPLSDDRVAQAVKTLADDYQGAAVLLARPKVALPLLRRAYARAEGQAKLIYAHTLAVLGDPAGVDTLIEAVDSYESWDEGWNYRAMGQFGSALSPLDRYIVALGRAGQKKAIPTILRKMKLLDAESAFSHHRAVALALEMLADRSAAHPLADLLTQPEMTGYVQHTVEESRQRDRQSEGGTSAVAPRRDSLRELGLARALFRCGDYGNLGRQILTDYTHDLRGHFARHAKAVLERGTGVAEAPKR